MLRAKRHHGRPAQILSVFFLMLCSIPALAHPMGNFSVNHYARITVGEKSVEVLYLIDMAEIPTYQEIRQFNLDPKPGEAQASQYVTEQEHLLGSGLSLESDGCAVQLKSVSRHLQFSEGAGGLPTMKIALLFRGTVNPAAGEHRLSYADNNFSGRAGWKEVVVASNGAEIVTSSASGTDRSQELTNYSSDLVNSPPQQVSASIDFRTVAVVVPRGVQASGVGTTRVHVPRSLPHAAFLASGGTAGVSVATDAAPVVVSAPVPAAPVSTLVNTPRSRFTQLISTQGRLSFWVLLSAAFIAAGLGALHALEPGHGKTIVAAYLVGSRGTARHAVLLGVVVTAAHTAGVYLLGMVTLYASRYIVPEQLYPWLGAISGISVAGLGVFVLLRNLTGETGDHSHASGKRHSHWFLSSLRKGGPSGDEADARPSSGSNPEPRALSLRELCMLGVTGGIVPCPAALVVLLSAFSLHRIGFGLYLITAFSVGLAAVLVSVGLAMVYTRRIVASRFQTSARMLRYLPFLSSAFMVVLGSAITMSAIAPLFTQALFSKQHMLPFVTVVLLGFFLGMRHSTDPDHVVAVSTIVSRQGSVRSSAMIGLLWGLGHTLTIFLVGSVIIVFGVVIPARLGLSMEFCVALMLILLGILNLTGVMAGINERLGRLGLAKRRGGNVNGASPALGKSRAEVLLERVAGRLGLYQTLRPLIIGLVHGLAGSAAVALLVLSTIKSPFWSTLYLLVFGFGTVAGMMLMTGAISMPLVFAGKRFSSITRHMTTASGLVSVAFGLFLVYHIGLIDGLFTAHPHWTPQ